MHSKVKCSYDWLCRTNNKPSRQKKFQIYNQNNNKTMANVKYFLATGFEFVYAITSFYSNILITQFEPFPFRTRLVIANSRSCYLRSLQSLCKDMAIKKHHQLRSQYRLYCIPHCFCNKAIRNANNVISNAALLPLLAYCKKIIPEEEE